MQAYARKDEHSALSVSDRTSIVSRDGGKPFGADKTMTARDMTEFDGMLSTRNFHCFLQILRDSFAKAHRITGKWKKPLEKIQNPVQTAGQNCRYLSPGVVKCVLTLVLSLSLQRLLTVPSALVSLLV